MLILHYKHISICLYVVNYPILILNISYKPNQTSVRGLTISLRVKQIKSLAMAK